MLTLITALPSPLPPAAAVASHPPPDPAPQPPGPGALPRGPAHTHGTHLPGAGAKPDDCHQPGNSRPHQPTGRGLLAYPWLMEGEISSDQHRWGFTTASTLPPDFLPTFWKGHTPAVTAPTSSTSLPPCTTLPSFLQALNLQGAYSCRHGSHLFTLAPALYRLTKLRSLSLGCNFAGKLPAGAPSFSVHQ